MIAYETDNTAKYFRWFGGAILLVIYAAFAYRLASFPNQWVGALLALCLGVIALLVISNRHIALLMAFVAAIPLVGFDFSLYFNEKLGGDYRIAASLLDFTLLGLWLKYMFFVPRAERQALRPAALKWLMTALFLLALLSTNFAKEVDRTFFEIIRLFRMMMLVWIIAKSVTDIEDLKIMIAVLFAMTIMEGFLAFGQRLSGGQLGITLLGEPDAVLSQDLDGDTTIRPGGTFGHANQFARFLGLVLPLALATVIATQNKRYRMLASATLIIGGGALVATLSRAAWIGFVMASSLVFAMMLLQPALRARAVQSLKLIALLIIPFVLINLNTFIARFTNPDEGSYATREPMARIAMKIIDDHPWGIGYGNYRLWLPRYGDPAVPFTFEQKVHNMYLLVAAELGIQTLIVFLGILFAVFGYSLYLARRAAPDHAMIATGIAAGLLAFMIHCIVDYEEIGRIPILWFQFGMVCALWRMHQNVTEKNVARASMISEVNERAARERLRNFTLEKN